MFLGEDVIVQSSNYEISQIVAELIKHPSQSELDTIRISGMVVFKNNRQSTERKVLLCWGTNSSVSLDQHRFKDEIRFMESVEKVCTRQELNKKGGFAVGVKLFLVAYPVSWEYSRTLFYQYETNAYRYSGVGPSSPVAEFIL
jgi:hypothetical protein